MNAFRCLLWSSLELNLLQRFLDSERNRVSVDITNCSTLKCPIHEHRWIMVLRSAVGETVKLHFLERYRKKYGALLISRMELRSLFFSMARDSQCAKMGHEDTVRNIVREDKIRSSDNHPFRVMIHRRVELC